MDRPVETPGLYVQPTGLHQGYARDTHASRAKVVANSVPGARRQEQLSVSQRGHIADAGPSQRSASRTTTDTMNSGRVTRSRLSLHGPSVPHTSTPICDPTPHPSTPVPSAAPRTPADQFLAQNGWRVDSNHNILICLECQQIINPSKVRDHILTSHREVRPDRKLQAQFAEACSLQYPGLTFEPAHPCSPVPFVIGLKTQEKIQLCSICKRGYGVDQDRDAGRMSRSFRKHECRKGVQNPPREFSVCPAQKFGQNFSWFAVVLTDAPVPPPPNDLWQGYKVKLVSRAPSANTASIPDDYRVLTQFLQKERWLEHVKGLDASIAIELCSCPTKDPIFGSLPDRVHAFLAKYQGKTTSYFLQRLIGTRPSSEHGNNYPRHHRAVHFDAHKKYSRCVASALGLLLRNVINPNPQYRFAVPQEIEQVARRLYHRLQANPYVVGDYNEDFQEDFTKEEADSDDEDDYPATQALPTVRPDLSVEEEVVWPLEHEVREDPAMEEETETYPYGIFEKREVPTYDDLAQADILELLQLLYTQNLSDARDSSFHSVLVRYIVLSSMRQSGQWRLASVITQVIAAILFTGRLTIAKIMLELRSSISGPLSA